MQGAWKVGLLVLVFVGLFIGAYALLGRSLYGQKSNIYFADFADAGGATPGTPVLMAGVKIGTVGEVSLTNPTLARLSLEIDKENSIPVGSTAQIQSSLTGLGQQPVVIVPPKRIAGMLPSHSVIKGVHASALDSFLPEAKDTVKELNKTLIAARQLLQDEKLKGGVEKLLETSNRTVEQFGLIAQHTNALMGQNQATIQQAVNNAARAMADIQKSTAIVAQMAQDKRFKNDTLAIVANLNATSQKAATLVDNLNAFVTDPKLRGPLNEVAANTAKITDTGTRIAANAEVISKNGIVMSQKAIELEDKAKGLADDAHGVLQKLEGVFGKKQVGSLIPPITGSLDVIRQSNPAHVRTDINFMLPLKDQRIHLGLYDAFESNKINAELGKTFGNGSEYLYGIYASKPGVGVDYRLAPRLFLRGDLYDVNHPRADIRARVEFGKGFYGWLGLDQVFKKNAPLIGIGFRK
jgi:phospholipid/cholesterol/gamma-HCH transport system substrate-binding protein